MNRDRYPVVIVGAGLAGLYCAHRLKKIGIDVIVVEAAPTIGGRIKGLKGFVDWKTLDLGAEFLHGNKTLLKDIVDEKGWPNRLLFTWAQGDGQHPKSLMGKNQLSMYYYGSEKKLVKYDVNDPELTRLNSALWEIGELEFSPNDPRTLEQYLLEKGFSQKYINLANAGYSNSLCATSDKLSIYEVHKLECAWEEYGEGDFRMENSLAEVIEHLSEGITIRTNWIVKSINYEGSQVQITSRSGEVLYGDKAVVTVPLNILKEGSIHFQPSLPQKKQMAIKALQMDNAIKIVIKVSERFWPIGLNGVICIDSLIPEVWFEHPERVGELTAESKPVTRSYGKDFKPTYIVSGFACSTFADALKHKTPREMAQILIDQLDDMFGDKKAFKIMHDKARNLEEERRVVDSKPATTYFLDYLVQDWSKEPFVRGGYTRAAPGSSAAIRGDLLAPINNRVFFAGEAAHPDSYMTMNGSVESAQIVSDSIIKQFKQSRL